MLNPFSMLIINIIDIYQYILIIWLIISWLISFNIINRYQPFVQKLMYALNRLTAPVLNPIRKRLPDLGGIDISPIILFLGLGFIKHSIVYYSIPRSAAL